MQLIWRFVFPFQESCIAKTKKAGQGQYLRISPYLKDPPSVNVDHLGVLRDAILGTMFEQNHCKYVQRNRENSSQLRV